MSAPTPPANRLIHESSPYLQQHAHNPVDWYPWSDEALARARTEDKPILLSVGYSACHWCHVMERESFEDPATAALMNDLFINIKVDREERPDVDQIYQTAVQVLGRHGGWPLTMFLTPSLKPFYGGTYFPPSDRYGMPAFKRVLVEVARAFREQRQQVDRQAEELVGYLKEVEGREDTREHALSREAVATAAEGLVSRFDEDHGGFGTRPKFPNSTALELWLRQGVASGDKAFIDRVAFTMRQMIEGGIYDQLGGGFHRYSTDERWLIPHFEKMLYDNALLLRLLVQLYQATGDQLFATTARETAEYVLREMTSPAGGFFSTQDADSEGEEGRFFVWTPTELTSLLGAADAELVSRVYGVDEGGNFEHGRSALHRTMPIEAAARLVNRDPNDARAAFTHARQALFAAREKRVHPGRDEKVLTGWNGLMIQALAQVGAVLGERRYVEAATRASEFIAGNLWSDGVLLRTWREGKAKISAFSEDYGFLAEGELALFEASGEPRHFERARTLVDQALKLFWDENEPGFFVARAEGEPSVYRPKSSYDNAIPSATASLVMALVRLHALTGEGEYASVAERTLRSFHASMARNAFGYTYLWCAFDAAVRGMGTMVVTGPQGQAEREAILAAARRPLAPNLLVVPWLPATPAPAGLASLVEGKGSDPAAYLCQGASCSAPMSSPSEVVKNIEASART